MRAYSWTIVVFSVVFVGLGIALLVRTAARKAVGYVLGGSSSLSASRG
jgi:hypothetical protein